MHLTQVTTIGSITEWKIIPEPRWNLREDFLLRKDVGNIWANYVGLMALYVHNVEEGKHGLQTGDTIVV